MPLNYEPNYDTIIVQLKSRDEASKFIKYLRKNKIFTKIIPDALNWHYVKYWKQLKKYMPSKKEYLKTDDILYRCVSLPILGRQIFRVVKKNCEVIANYKIV